ncbi:hypothetical protein ACO1O0_005968 [Amphichorda felina]
MADYERFKWRETQPGRWVRDLDEPERAYTSLFKRFEGTGRSFFHMTGHLSLTMVIPEGQSRAQAEANLDQALKKAWIALRCQHPNLASQTKLDPDAGKWVKEYVTNADGWLEKTFVLVPGNQTGAEWSNNDPPAPPLPTMNVISPAVTDEHTIRRDLIFRAPHDIIDGMGTLLLFDNYTRLTVEALGKGDSYQVPALDDPLIIDNLSPPYRVAANVPPETSEAIKQRLASIAAAEEADASNTIEIASLPHKSGVVAPGVHKRVELILPPDEASALLAASKRIGATVTHVFHAALALALRDLQTRKEEPRPIRLDGYLLRNERGTCQPPYNDHRHPTGVYHSVSGDKLTVNMTVPAQSSTRSQEDDKAEFLRIVEQMKQFYTAVRDDRDHYALAPHLWAKGTAPLPTEEQATPPPFPPPSEIAPVSISSMGRIDGVIAHRRGPVEVADPWVTGEELRNGLGLFLGTFRGSLSLSAAYNDAWIEKEEATAFLRRCMDLVKDSLDC